MKVYLDDIRTTPEGWYRTYTAKETIEVLKTGKVVELSLDHDLNLAHYANQDLHEETGYDVLLWIEEQIAVHNNLSILPAKIHLHTANPSGRERMQRCLKSIEKMSKKNI